MRRMKTAFLSCAAVAAAALLAAPAAMATGGYSTCSLSLKVDVTKDDAGVQTPCPVVPSGTTWRCAGPNEASSHTGIRYKNISGTSLDSAAVLVTSNNTVVQPPSTQVVKNCEGDPVTGLGKRTCHADAVKLNGVANTGTVWVVVTGRQLPIATTIAAKKGSSSCIRQIATIGLGLTASSSQLIQQVQRVTSQDGCAVDFITDSLTGDVLSAKLTAESLANGCTSPSLNGDTIEPLDATEFEVFRGSESFGTWKFGEGYIRSGLNSCTTRVIGGRVYTWGDPCPE